MFELEIEGGRLGQLSLTGTGVAHGAGRWNAAPVSWFDFGQEGPHDNSGPSPGPRKTTSPQGGASSDRYELDQISYTFQTITRGKTGSGSADDWGAGSGSGGGTGKRRHLPIVIVKQFGPSTPNLLQAVCNNETLSKVVIQLNDQFQLGGHRLRRVVLGPAWLAGIEHVSLRRGPGHIFFLKGNSLEDDYG